MGCDSWSRVSIKGVCESIIDCVNKTAPTVEGPTPFKMIRTTNVKRGWIDLSQVKYVTEEISVLHNFSGAAQGKGEQRTVRG